MFKSFLFISCIGALLFACSSPESEKPVEKLALRPEEPVDSINKLQEYEMVINSLDSTRETSVTAATEKYQELFSKSDQKLCDSGFVLFHKFYEKVEGYLGNSVFSDPVYQELPCVNYDENGKELPMDKRLAALEKRMSKHGFRLECWEGFPGVGVEGTFVAKHFYKYVSPEMRKFLKELHHENDYVYQVDAGITLSEAEYVERLIWWENFIRENPHFILIKRAKAIQTGLFTFFLLGLDNTPTISYYTDENGVETLTPEPYFIEACSYLNKKYPRSQTNLLVKPYFQAAERKDKAKMDRIVKDYTRKGNMVDFSKDFDWNL